MATSFREKIFSPLAPEEARELVAEANAIIGALYAADADAEPVADPGIDGFHVVERAERDADGYADLDVFEDVDIALDASSPPTAAEVRTAAHATGYAPSSFYFEPAALARLPSCRSTIVVEYVGRVHDKPPFVALQKLVFARVGEAVVWSGEGTRLTTLETAAAERANEVGETWATTRPLGSRERVKKARKTRAAKPGEVEAVSVHERLSRIIEGSDPFARDALKKALERTNDAVRAYAASLMEDGARSDASVAKALTTSAKAIEAARQELATLLSAID